MPLYRPLPTQPPHQPQPLRKLRTPGVITQGAQASPSILLSLAPSAFAALGATASPSITLRLAPVALKIAVATAAPSITLSLAPAAIWVARAQASPSITLSLAPVGLKIAVATASPSITLSLAPAGLDIALALATPSIQLTLSPDAGAAVFTATTTPSITLTFAGNTVTDSFDRANNASSLGTADSGQVWSSLVGTWGISSNKAVVSNVASWGHAVLESGIADAVVQATLSPTDAAQTFISGLALRIQDATNGLAFRIRPQFGLASLIRLVNGSESTIRSVSYTRSASSVLRVNCTGTTIDCYVDDVLVIHATNVTDFPTATKHGLYCFASVPNTWDNFSVSTRLLATVFSPRTASPSILLVLTASAQAIHTPMLYTAVGTSNRQGLVEPVLNYRGAP